MAKEKERPMQDLPVEDEFAGQGGSYTLNPVTGKRTKNVEEEENA
jgi:hypothetical protein